MTILLTTHYIEEAEQLCERVAIINNGEIVKLDSKKNLMKLYQNKNLEEIFIQLTQ